MVALLVVFQLLQSSDGRLYCDGKSGVGLGTPSYGFHVRTTVPDPHSLSFCLGFATEGTSVTWCAGLFQSSSTFS